MKKPIIAGTIGLLSVGTTGLAAAAERVIDPELFSSIGALSAPEIVDCSLSNGGAAQCYQFVYTSLPEGTPTGPFCPETVDETGGLWLWDGDQPGLYALNKAFWDLMASLGYNFTDADGTVHVADPSDWDSRPAAGSNNCLERGVDPSVEITAQIPLEPVMLDAPQQLGTVAAVGLALDGVPIFADAPSVLDTGNLPALDYCGGHFDPAGYYHWHEVATDADTVLANAELEVNCSLDQSPSALFAFAYDGYPIYGSVDSDGLTPTDLDACNGHVSPTREFPDGVYHYHAGAEAHSPPTCLAGATPTDAFRTNAAIGVGSSGRGPGPGGMRPPPR